jgi:4-amino-4-deoxy-L-arabinose transferase-like glycosyltransferase
MKDRLLLLILTIYLIVTLGYGVVNPLFEAPDEHWHFFTAVYIAENRKLPVVEEPYDPWLSQEAAQPPLYYLLAAALISPLNTSNAREDVWLNPFRTQAIGNAAALTNRNQIIHTAAEQWPWAGTPLAAHLLRIFSTLLGLGTLLIIYKSGKLLWPTHRHRWLLATALVAFLPQFNFLHASISNDPLIIFLCTAALWQLIWLWQHPSTPKRLLLLGITIGLAALSKNTGVLLLLFSVGFLLIGTLTNRLPSQKKALWMWGWQTAVFVILPVLLIAGWLWWRNWQLYGDWTATSQFIRIAGGDRGYTLRQVLAESGGLWRSLFAVFGWFNLLAPTWVYWVWNGLVGVGLVGLIIRKETGDWRLEISLQSLLSSLNLPLLLAGWVAAVYGGLLLFMLQTPAAQGRLLFPAILPLALGLAAGLANWRWRPLLWLAPSLALITTVYSLWGVVAPAYQPPSILQRLPASAQSLDLEMGSGVQLLGIDVETETAVPGDIIWFTLFWQADTVPTSPPELVVDILGRDLTSIGNSHSYHGGGQFPASQWPEGGIVADRMGIRLAEEVATPVLAQIFVRLLTDEATNPPSLPVGTVKVVPNAWPEQNEVVLAEIGGAVQLTAVSFTPQQAQPGETITINVQWQVLAPPLADWTTLIHLAEVGQPPLATGDSPPLKDSYPTRAWASGEIFADQYQLQLPDDLENGRYPLWLGMYSSDTIVRQPLLVNALRQPNDLYQIGWITVSVD